jgi:hypothetical protein
VVEQQRTAQEESTGERSHLDQLLSQVSPGGHCRCCSTLPFGAFCSLASCLPLAQSTQNLCSPSLIASQPAGRQEPLPWVRFPSYPSLGPRYPVCPRLPVPPPGHLQLLRPPASAHPVDPVDPSSLYSAAPKSSTFPRAPETEDRQACLSVGSIVNQSSTSSSKSIPSLFSLSLLSLPLPLSLFPPLPLPPYLPSTHPPLSYRPPPKTFPTYQPSIIHLWTALYSASSCHSQPYIQRSSLILEHSEAIAITQTLGPLTSTASASHTTCALQSTRSVQVESYQRSRFLGSLDP